MDEKMRKLYALQNIIEEQRGTGEISRAEAARQSAELSERLGGLKRGSQSDMYEYDTEPEYGVKTYGPESDSEYFSDRSIDDAKYNFEGDDIEPELQEEIDLDKKGAYEESSRESQKELDYLRSNEKLERQWDILNRE